MQSLVKMRPFVSEDHFKMSLMYFHLITIISTQRIDMALHLIKLESPLSKDALCQIQLKLALQLWRRFLKLSIYLYFVLIISSQTNVAFHLKRLEFHYIPLIFQSRLWGLSRASTKVDYGAERVKGTGLFKEEIIAKIH